MTNIHRQLIVTITSDYQLQCYLYDKESQEKSIVTIDEAK